MILELAIGAAFSLSRQRSGLRTDGVPVTASSDMTQITRETVLHIASLARLRLSEDEVDALKTDLSKIVSYVAELDEVDTSGVPPTSHMAATTATRPDRQQHGLTQAEALREAPRSISGGFAVPGFVDET